MTLMNSLIHRDAGSGSGVCARSLTLRRDGFQPLNLPAVLVGLGLQSLHDARAAAQCGGVFFLGRLGCCFISFGQWRGVKLASAGSRPVSPDATAHVATACGSG